jgi:hypothetical protein
MMSSSDFEEKLKRIDLDTEIKPFESEDGELNDFLLNDAKHYLYFVRPGFVHTGFRRNDAVRRRDGARPVSTGTRRRVGA